MVHARDLFDLTGKVAIITGGGRGLGREIALGYAEMGADVVLCSRRVENCEQVAEEVRALGRKALPLACNVAEPENVRRVVDESLRTFGHIDILVNNSGASWGTPAVDMPLDAWHKVMETNVTGTFLMSQAVGRHMIERGQGGRIVNIASVAGLVGSPPEVLDAVGYSASKGAIISLTRDLAVKWARYNILVNAIAPGFFPTKMSRVILERNGDTILRGTPLGRFGEEGELKGVAIFLASPASSYVTGHVLTVDGGSTVM
ncbi:MULTISPECIES: SDR family oxidoreductase [Kyrpidia]|uniref:2-dehydro-3-deoxy-D-gluconate 5-dehydrogenase n=2 Tax=Kyrpidia spormannii TaxID=2055160 RepID=A0A6F9EBM5_9BACL|nr:MULTISPECIES: SDR family oxidoreductase [Kyrpidia]MCL6575227.1 SDR family oxidoreductase [Kyrpidia sp.]CAB3394245.1 2-dehydro-3-deoxy-D-gluconate 5-dehydrogenase [Kyrpidia spormannii]CAB3395174.1 2-dehydro-3-deoxy-D-gluconate 5-dehydrogenase [Kyrpidia spormannii]